MNIRFLIKLGLAVFLIFPVEQAQAGRGNGGQGKGNCIQGTCNGQGRTGANNLSRGKKGAGNCSAVTNPATLTEAEVTTLKHMYEEEKLAQNVYALLNAQWGALPFSKIEKSETKHMSAVKRQLDLHKVDASALEALPAGQFSTSEFQALYDSLAAQGKTSLVDALKAGVSIEQLDISDLNAAISSASAVELKKMYGNLLTASTQHLAAFSRQLTLNGASNATIQAAVRTGRNMAAKQQGKGNRKGNRGGNCPAS